MTRHQKAAKSSNIVITLLAFGVVLAATVAQGQTTIYMWIEGSEQGVITAGELTTPGHEDEVLALAVTHSLEIPLDIHTGLPSGQRKHGAMNVVKAAGPSSVLVNQALVNGEQLTVRIRFFKDDGGGETHYMTIELENAVLVSVKPRAVNSNEQSPATPPHLDTVSFIYGSITWTWVEGGISFEDVWNTPVP